MKKVFIFLLTLVFFVSVFSQGIIIGDDDFVLYTFRDSTENEIRMLAQSISLDYDKAILHLGARYPFDRNNFFFFRSSQRNLEIFSHALNEFGVEFYLWIFDSFGGEDFLDLYYNKENLIFNNLDIIEDMDIIYDGLIIDLEWINMELEKDFGINDYYNNRKYIEFIRLLRQELPEDKKLKAFASLIDNHVTSYMRGYNVQMMLEILDEIIPMIYIEDDEFLIRDGRVVPAINNDRIINILEFFDNYPQINIATSVNKGIYVQRNNRFYFIRTINIKDLPRQFELVDEDVYDYFTIQYYKVTECIDFMRNDEAFEPLVEGEYVFYYHPNQKLIESADYIWNYYLTLK